MSTLPSRPSAQPGDALGYRVLGFDKKTGDRLEMLRLRPQLAGQAPFEAAMRDRLQRLADLRGPGFARIRQVDRLTGQASGLAIVSTHVEGARLADLLQTAEMSGVRVDIDTALCLLRQLVAAIANLHETGADISHGCIGPERLLVTPDARLIVSEYILGSALEGIEWPRERFWQEMRIALPPGENPATLDQRGDLLQIGLVALALLAGRGLYAEKQYPLPLADRLAQAEETSLSGAPRPLGAALSSWLARALLLEPEAAFASTADAQSALDAVIADGYLAAPASVAAFLERCQQAAPTDASASVGGTTSAGTGTSTGSGSGSETRDGSRSGDTMATSGDEKAALGGERPARKARITQPLAQPYPAPAAATAAGLAGTSRPEISGEDIARLGVSSASAFATGQSSSTRGSAAQVVPIGAGASESGRVTGRANADPGAPDARGKGTDTDGGASANAMGARGASRTTTVSGAAPAIASGLSRGAPAAGARATSGASSADPALDGARSFASKLPLVIQPDAMVDDNTPLNAEMVAAEPRRVRRSYVLLLGLAAVLALAFNLVLRYANPFDGSPAQASVPAMLPATKGVLNIDASPKTATVFVDDVARGTTPLKLDLAAGPHTIRLDGGEGLTRTFPVTVAAGKEISHLVELARSAETGSIDVRSDPAGARVLMDGKLVGLSPVTINDIEPGDHTVTVEGQQTSVRQSVKVIAGTRASVVVPLTASPAGQGAGWLSVTADQEMQVIEAGQILGSSRADRIMMPAGTHDLELTNDAIGVQVTRQVQVQPGKVTRLAIPIADGAVSVNATPWAEVWLDGQRIGETPVGNFAAKAGSHDLVFRHPKLGERKQTVIVKPGQTARVTLDMSK